MAATKPSVEFWSSTEYTTFQPALARELQLRGWPVAQRFAVDKNAYWHARGRLARLSLRFRCYGWYPLTLAREFARRTAPRIGVVCTNTFYAPRVALAAAGKQTPVIHWVFDLYPDVMTAAGTIRANGLVERALRSTVRATFDRAAANVFLGESLRWHAEEKFGPIPRAEVIHIGADGKPFADTPPAPLPSGTLRLLYCGNLGRMHDVDTIAQVIASGLPDGVSVDFRGNGFGFRALEAALTASGNRSRVKLGGNLPGADWVAEMKAAHVALVTVRPGSEGLVMPSKTYSALVAGQAILAVCPIDSDLAALVRTHDAGWVIAPGDTEALKALLRRLAQTPSEVLAKRLNAWRIGHAHFDQAVLARQWDALLQTVAAGIAA